MHPFAGEVPVSFEFPHVPFLLVHPHPLKVSFPSGRCRPRNNGGRIGGGLVYLVVHVDLSNDLGWKVCHRPKFCSSGLAI
eukprot:647560-Amphidinium_carterae.1